MDSIRWLTGAIFFTPACIKPPETTTGSMPWWAYGTETSKKYGFPWLILH